MRNNNNISVSKGIITGPGPSVVKPHLSCFIATNGLSPEQDIHMYCVFIK